MRSSPDLRGIVRSASEVAALPAMDVVASASSNDDDPSDNAQARLDGFREGRLEGVARGLVEGRASGEESVKSVLAALSSAIEKVEASHTASTRELEALAVSLALELAEAVIGRELAVAGDPGGDAIRRALALRSDREAVAVRLHPDDFAVLEPMGLDLDVEPDPTVPRGGAAVTMGDGTVDATLEAALARVREVLT